MANNNSSGKTLASAVPALTAFDYFLYGTTIFAWSTSWYALKLQIGVVPVHVSLFWRFLIAALVMISWALITKARMKFSALEHLKFAGMGMFIFCLNFMSFYYAANWLASGLLSVVFAAVAIFNIVMNFIFLKTSPSKNMKIGALFGMSGVVLMFWPAIIGQSFDLYALIGLGLCLLGTLFFSTGNLISSILQKSGISVVSASAWGMAYGAGLSLIISLVLGSDISVEWNINYLGSLFFLALVSSVIAFAAYLTLLGRIGSNRAGYTTVVFPVFALMVSAVLEDYQLTLLAGAGLALVLIGNIFVMGKNRTVKPAQSSS